MAPLNVILFALAAASQTSTCNGDDSVSDLCLLQLKGEADTETKAVQATKASSPCTNQDGTDMSEFECYVHASCYWTPGETIPEGKCWAYS